MADNNTTLITFIMYILSACTLTLIHVMGCVTCRISVQGIHLVIQFIKNLSYLICIRGTPNIGRSLLESLGWSGRVA